MKKILFLSVAMLLTMSLFAQEKINEGILIAKQSMSSDNEQMNAQLKAMGDTNATTYFKGEKSRSETSSPMTGDVTIIIDAAEQQMLMMMDRPGMGKKYMLQSFAPSEEDLKNVTVEKGTATKTILGYECQQYIIGMKQNGQDVKMEMYTTDQISAVSQNTTAMGDKVEGFPLYFVMTMNQMGATIEVTSEIVDIKKTTVADEKLSLTPPEGYTNMGGL
ncbi:DUF4412 domain-containing protein [Winogradskyella rapida]|uniref:DUF4412 domain-containing protein n=1 Tax=Winogradskyella rapida TaxID=549701 RepID=A0ABW3KPS9_9FLAO